MTIKSLQSTHNVNFISYSVSYVFYLHNSKPWMLVKRCASSQTPLITIRRNCIMFTALFCYSPAITVSSIEFVSDDDFDVIFLPLSRSFFRKDTTRGDEKEPFLQNHNEESELKIAQVELEVKPRKAFQISRESTSDTLEIILLPRAHCAHLLNLIRL